MMDSWHSTISYTSISSLKRSWDIPNVDPYEEAALQAIEQVAPPLSPAYLPDPIELDEHVPVYVLEPEYPEYLELPADDIVAEDQPHADDAVPTALFLAIEQVAPPLSPAYLPDPIELDEHARSWSIPYKDPYEEAAQQLLEQAPHSLEYAPDPIELEDHIPLLPLHVPSLPPIPYSPLPPLVLVETHSPEQDVTAALLMLPSTTRKSEVPEADMPPGKRLCFATPTTGFEVGKSSAAAARPPRDLYGFVDTTKTEESITRRHARTLHNTERRMMTVVELVNLRVAPPLSPAYLPDPIELDEHVPVYVLEPEYPEYLELPADDIVAEDQPHADDAVPTALFLVADSDPEEDLEEDLEEDEIVDYANEPEEEDTEEEDLEEEDLKEEKSDDNAAGEKEPSEGSNDIEQSEEDKTAITPPPSRLRGA
nr:hypothetical protein [Tanacetum cinerariifolium]